MPPIRHKISAINYLRNRLNTHPTLIDMSQFLLRTPITIFTAVPHNLMYAHFLLFLKCGRIPHSYWSCVWNWHKLIMLAFLRQIFYQSMGDFTDGRKNILTEFYLPLWNNSKVETGDQWRHTQNENAAQKERNKERKNRRKACSTLIHSRLRWDRNFKSRSLGKESEEWMKCRMSLAEV
jgi:hypothetical protein